LNPYFYLFFVIKIRKNTDIYKYNRLIINAI